MNNQFLNLPSTRREFLTRSTRGIGLLAFSRFAPAFLTHTTLANLPAPEKDRTILVLVQLAGGNDGLNTLIPYQDDNYYRLRPRLAINRREVIPLGENLAFHPAFSEMAALYKEGELGIVQNVGYPNPNRSHFRSSEIWETASDSNEYRSTGWLGRFFDNNCCGKPQSDSPLAVHIGSQLPQTFQSETPHNLFGINRRMGERKRPFNTALMESLINAPVQGENVRFLQHTMMDAIVTEKRIQRITEDYLPLTDYPDSRLGQSLRGVAAMIEAELETRVYFVSQSGYDTHIGQLNAHNRLLSELSTSLAAFQKDLHARHLDDQVLTVTFSEFGRRPSENNGAGTDHGTAAPLFLLGSKLKRTLHGTAPSLNLAAGEDLTYSTDFRQVYATVLKHWFQCQPGTILGGDFPPLNFV